MVMLFDSTQLRVTGFENMLSGPNYNDHIFMIVLVFCCSFFNWLTEPNCFHFLYPSSFLWFCFFVSLFYCVIITMNYYSMYLYQWWLVTPNTGENRGNIYYFTLICYLSLLFLIHALNSYSVYRGSIIITKDPRLYHTRQPYYKTILVSYSPFICCIGRCATSYRKPQNIFF